MYILIFLYLIVNIKKKSLQLKKKKISISKKIILYATKHFNFFFRIYK